VICFSKRLPGSVDGTPADTVLVVVNLNPHQVREATVHLDLPALGLDPRNPGFVVTDELSGESYQWGQANYVRLDPYARPAHVFVLDRSGSTSPLRSSES
jgi:starch synthase (maltosyl-transferring)